MTVSKIVLGLWPIAGITTVGVTPEDGVETIRRAIDLGISQFDTAFAYGYDGESDRMLGDAIRSRRDGIRVIGKVGQRWTADRQRVNDGAPATLTADAEESLQRIGMDSFDLLMLHVPDPNVPLEVSAEAIASMQRRGLAKRIGVCNVDAQQYQRFRNAAGCDAIQCPLNLLQADLSADLIQPCREDQCDVYTYWTLMKGLLAGKIRRDHVFAAGDSRPGYAIFQGEQRAAAHDVLDELKGVAADAGQTLAQLAIGWAISQPGVTAALVGARRPEQITETASASVLTAEVMARVEAIVQPRRDFF